MKSSQSAVRCNMCCIFENIWDSVSYLKNENRLRSLELLRWFGQRFGTTMRYQFHIWQGNPRLHFGVKGSDLTEIREWQKVTNRNWQCQWHVGGIAQRSGFRRHGWQELRDLGHWQEWISLNTMNNGVMYLCMIPTGLGGFSCNGFGETFVMVYGNASVRSK